MKNIILKKKNTLAIVGGFTETRRLFDFSRDDCDVIMFNEAGFFEKPGERCDLCIQLHDPAIWRNPTNPNDPRHYERLKNSKIPVLMQEEFDDVPMSVKFPLEEITRKYGNFLLSSSAAECIAWALYMGYRRIEIYGVEMATNTEYAVQRPGVTYWIGYARAILGNENVVFYNSTFPNEVYGFGGNFKIEEEWFTERLKNLQDEHGEIVKKHQEVSRKAADAVNRYADTGEGGDVIPDVIRELSEVAFGFGEIDGRLLVIDGELKRIQKSKLSVSDYITNRQYYEKEHAIQERSAEDAVKRSTAAAQKTAQAFQFVLGANGNAGKRRYRMKNFVEEANEYKKSSAQAGYLRGISLEFRHLMIVLDGKIAAAGGNRSAEVVKSMEQV